MPRHMNEFLGVAWERVAPQNADLYKRVFENEHMKSDPISGFFMGVSKPEGLNDAQLFLYAEGVAARIKRVTGADAIVTGPGYVVIDGKALSQVDPASFAKLQAEPK